MADDPRPPDDKETADRNRLPSASIHVTSPHLATHDDAQAYEELLDALRKDLQLDLGTDVIPPLGWNVSAKLWQTAAWIVPTLLNSWVPYAGGYGPPGYLKDPFGFVHLRGQLKNGTVNTTAFVLPAGYRPSGSNQYPSVNNGGGGTYGTVASVYIDSTGVVNILGSQAPTFVTLGGITFLAEA